tara:strand:+ start:8646 stop:9806 length:1161 start_codon:yes stop_codon:yes gene_type:complete
MTKRKICVVTGTRAEYGLLYWLMSHIDKDPMLELQIIATGMHCSTEFGLTQDQIEKDNFTINKKIEMLLSSDTPQSISKSTGLGLIGFADAYVDLAPDIVVVLGDRFELLAASTAALFSRIPIAHIHGGETTSGAFDEAIRHSITKMSWWHFVAANEYKNRVIQLGEHKSRIFNVGGMGVDYIKRSNLLSKKDLENNLNFKFGKKNLLVTFHPVTLEKDTSKEQFKNLVEVLSSLSETKIIFTYSNSDTNGRIINEIIDNYVYEHPNSSKSFASMGQINYLSTLQFVDAVVGNSSSGLLEAPSFKIGTINIGDRQTGRLKSKSVIDCSPAKSSIRRALANLYKQDFKDKLLLSKNPYGEGKSVEKIIKILKKSKMPKDIKKEFIDL